MWGGQWLSMVRMGDGQGMGVVMNEMMLVVKIRVDQRGMFEGSSLVFLLLNGSPTRLITCTMKLTREG